MPVSEARIRTALRTNPIIGGVVSWGWKHYVTAVCLNSHNDSADIPKVQDAGRIFHGSDEKEEAYQLMHNGLKIKLGSFYDDFNLKIIEQLKGFHEPQEEKVFYEVLASLPDDITMIEVGSYWGYYSMWAQKSKPKARNFLIEPLEEHLTAGKENFALNSMAGEFHRAYIGETSKGPHSIKLEGVTCKNIERVSIDDFMEKRNISFAHIIHGDIQGAEFDLLKGSRKTIANGRVGYFFISTHGRKVHSDCLQYLTKNDFKIIASHTKKESFTTDGLIVARAKSFDGLEYVEIAKKRNVLYDIPIVMKSLLSR